MIRNDADGKSYLYDLLNVEKKKVISKTSFSANLRSEVTSPKPSDNKISKSSEVVNPQNQHQERGTSNREILTTALESAAQNPREREVLAEYKAAADKLETYEARLRENRAKVQELTAENEKKNARKIAKLKEDIKADENRVGNVTDQMKRESTDRMERFIQSISVG